MGSPMGSFGCAIENKPLFQAIGTAAMGQEIPEINRKGTDVKTKAGMHDSRGRSPLARNIAKKVQART